MPGLFVVESVRALLAGFLVLAPVVFWYGLLEPFESCKSPFTQLTALAILVLASTTLRTGGLTRLRGLFAGPIGLAVAAGVVVAGLTTIFSCSPRTSLQGAVDSHDGLGHVLALAVLFAASRAVRLRGELLAVSVIGLALACGYALIQVSGADPVRWEHVSAYHSWLRPIGTMGHPCYLAGYAVMVLPLLVWCLVEGDRRARIAGVVLTVVVLAVIVATLSRGPWLAGAVAGLVLLLLWPGRPLAQRLSQAGELFAVAVVLGGIACAILGPSFIDSLVQRLAGIASSAGRRPVWQAAWRIFLDHPGLGTGLDTFGLAFTQVRTPAYWAAEWGILPRRAHNDLLHALATQGIAGGLAYLGLAIGLLLTCVRLWRHRPDDRRLLIPLVGVVVAFYVQNLVGFAVAGTASLFAIVAGAIAGLQDGPAPDSERVPGTSVLVAAILGGVVLVASLAQGVEPANGWRLLLVSSSAVIVAGLGLMTCGVPLRVGVLRFGRDAQRSVGIALATAILLGLPLGWWIVRPVVASVASRRGDAERDWHDVAVRLAPDYDIFHARRAIGCLNAAGREGPAWLDEARRSIEEACRLMPLCAGHHANRGRVLFEVARADPVRRVTPETVLSAFDRAIELDGCDLLALVDAARAAASLGRLDEAERYLARCRAIDAELGPLHAERGAVLLAKAARTVPLDARLLAEAEAALRLALAKDWHGEEERHDRALLVLALTLLERRNAEEALHWTNQVLTRRPDWLNAQWLHGAVCERLGRRQAALEAYQGVLRVQPDNAQARAGLSRLQTMP